MFRVDFSGLWVSGFGYRVSGFGFRASGFGYRVSGSGFLVAGHNLREQLLHRNVQRSRGGLVFKAHRLCVSLNSRLESNKEEEEPSGGAARAGTAPRRAHRAPRRARPARPAKRLKSGLKFSLFLGWQRRIRLSTRTNRKCYLNTAIGAGFMQRCCELRE